MTRQEIEEALAAAGVRSRGWTDQPEKSGLFPRECSLLERLEQVISAQVNADKAKLTELQLALHRAQTAQHGTPHGK